MIGGLIGGIRKMIISSVEFVRSLKMSESQLGLTLMAVGICGIVLGTGCACGGIMKFMKGRELEALEHAIKIGELKAQL